MTFPRECQYHAPMEPPYDDNGDWLDVLVLSKRVQTARKEHRCDGVNFDTEGMCREPIKPGQKYIRRFQLENGKPYFLKCHITCYIES